MFVDREKMIALIKSGAIGRPPANRFADKTFFAPFDNRDPNSYIIRFAEFLKFLPCLVRIVTRVSIQRPAIAAQRKLDQTL